MAPNQNERNLEVNQGTGILDESEYITNKIHQSAIKPGYRPLEIRWRDVSVLSVYTCMALYGVYLGFTSAGWKTILFGILNFELGMFGTTAGAHRLWAHRSYKAKLPLKLILLCCQTLAYQLSVIEWCRQHRSHHKFQETDADPHNANRGFFFAHWGWLMCKRHPDVKEKGKTLDLSDLRADPLLRLINPVETPIVSFLTLGEGWHNYHHTFPWDYKTAELGKLNLTLFFIDLFAKIGWAYDLKTVSRKMVKSRVLKTGDGSHEIWGWGNKDQTKEDYDAAIICNRIRKTLVDK